MATRFTPDELVKFIIVASQADIESFSDYATQAAILKAKSHVIDEGGGLIYCPPVKIGR